MANFKLTQTGEQIQADLDLLDKNSATQGQVLTANGTGGATWQDATGGGTEVVANPTAEATEELSKLQVGSIVYSIPTGGGSSNHLYYNFSFNAYNSVIGSEKYFSGLFDFSIDATITDVQVFIQKMKKDYYPIWGTFQGSDSVVYSVSKIYKSNGSLYVGGHNLNTGASKQFTITNIFFQYNTHLLFI